MAVPGSSKDIAPLTPGAERMMDLFVRPMTALNVWAFKLSGGRIGNKFSHGAPVCLLTTTGRKSGKQRTVALIYAEEGDAIVMVASKGGATKHPLWYLNLAANPECEIQIGSETRKLRARRASDEEKEKIWPKLNEVYPEYENYQARTARNIPVMFLEAV
jgi:deazaflavin-dependent oxidoreductase (nitroreductase family)